MIIFEQQINAQEFHNQKGTINFGFETGVQFTSIVDPYMLISDGGVGFSAGPFFEFFLSDEIKFRGGANFDSRAFSLQDYNLIMGDSGYVGRSSYYDIVEEYKINYLTIPLSLIYIKGINRLKLYLQGTFYYSILLNAKQTGYTYIYISEEDAPHFFFNEHHELNTPGHHYLDPEIRTLNTSDFGINIFLGVIYNINKTLSISLSPGFTYSFPNVWENPERQATWAQLYKINAGIIYTLKSK